MLRRIMSIAPNFYKYGYNNQGKMWIDTSQDLKQVDVAQGRIESVRSSLLKKTKDAFLKWC